MHKVALATIAILFSATSMASSVEYHLNAEVVKATVPAATLNATLDAWRENALMLANVEKAAMKMSARAPIEARRVKVRNDIEREYKRLVKLYSL